MLKNTSKKKTKETVKDELLNSLMKKNKMEEQGLEEMANIIADPKEAIRMIKHYEQMVKTQNKKVINIFGRQGQLLKKFKDNKNLFKTTCQSKSTIYFKIRLNKFLKKFPVLKKLTL